MYVKSRTCKILSRLECLFTAYIAVKGFFMRIGDSNRAQNVIRYILIALLLMALLFTSFLPCNAQSATMNNTGEWLALKVGNDMVNKAVGKQMDSEIEIFGLQTVMNGNLTQMKVWERKYIQYLETVEGFASTLHAGSMIFADGVKVLMNLKKLTQALADNPEGLITTAGMNNLYMETFGEFTSMFTMMDKALKKGGKDNLLDGRARCQLLWALEDKMDSLNRKLARLVISVGSYNLVDLWYSRAGYVTYKHDRSWARNNHELWMRKAKAAWKYNPAY